MQDALTMIVAMRNTKILSVLKGDLMNPDESSVLNRIAVALEMIATKLQCIESILEDAEAFKKTLDVIE